jgi:hypothetical protein
VTYTFDTATNAASDDLVAQLDDVATRLRRDGVPIEFRGGIQRIDADGRVVELTARFDARTKGTVGRLNCHGGATGERVADPCSTRTRSGADVVAPDDRSRRWPWRPGASPGETPARLPVRTGSATVFKRFRPNADQ